MPQTSEKRQASAALTELSIHAVLLIVTCALLFSWNHAQLFLGYDGGYMRELVSESFALRSPIFSNNLSLLQGMGSIVFPLQFKLSPAAAIGQAIGISTSAGVIAYYTVIAAELFLATFFCGVLLGLRRSWSLVIAWICTLSILPVFPNALIYPVAAIGPWLIEQVAFTTCVIAVILLLVRPTVRTWGQTGCIIALAALATYIVLYLPITALLSVVWLTFAFIGINVPRINHLWLRRPLPRVAFVLAALYIFASVTPYLVGLNLTTVTAFFTPELIANRPKVGFISILYYGPLGQGWYNTLVYVFGMASCVYFFFRTERSDIRAISGTILIYCLFLQALGLSILLLSREYTAVWPLYFEWQIWPFLFIFIGMASHRIFCRFNERAIPGVLRAPANRLRTLASGARLPNAMPIRLLAFGSALLVTLFACSIVIGSKVVPNDIPFPPRETPIVTTLKNEIGIYPDGKWRGSMLNITGAHARPLDGKITWNNQNGFDAILLYSQGNDQRSWGLWWQGIPTVFVYNQVMSPFFYAYATRAFATPNDLQQRGVLILSTPHINALRLIGTRFLMTDHLLAEQPGLRLRERFPTTPAEPFPRQQIFNLGFNEIYLYEIENVNLGQYSPTEVFQARSAAKTLELVLAPSFDPTRSVLTTEALPQPLIPVETVDVNFQRGTIHIRALTSGDSLIVLPIVYSHCLSVQVNEGAARTIRANLTQTGVLLRGNTVADITYRNGPFISPYCQLMDWHDGIVMRLGQLAYSKN